MAGKRFWTSYRKNILIKKNKKTVIHFTMKTSLQLLLFLFSGPHSFFLYATFSKVMDAFCYTHSTLISFFKCMFAYWIVNCCCCSNVHAKLSNVWTSLKADCLKQFVVLHECYKKGSTCCITMEILKNILSQTNITFSQWYEVMKTTCVNLRSVQ